MQSGPMAVPLRTAYTLVSVHQGPGDRETYHCQTNHVLVEGLSIERSRSPQSLRYISLLTTVC